LRSPRVLIIGLDAATPELVSSWSNDGHLPNLARMIAEGAWGKLRSTLQPVTSAAWTTIMTGANQGKHGLYDFVQRLAGTYSVEVTDASHIKLPTILEIASRFGKRVVSINMPYTSPPPPVNGIIVGGPFAPAINKRSVYPADFIPILREIVPDYFILPDYDPSTPDPMGAFATRLHEEIEQRERLCLRLMQSETWDLFTVVFMAADEAQHSFWHCQTARPGTKEWSHRNVIRDVYQRLDAAIGRLVAQAITDEAFHTTVLVISDHGAGPLRWLVNLNRWLAQQGFLHYTSSTLTRLAQVRASGLRNLARAYRRIVPPRLRALLRSQSDGRLFARMKGKLESTINNTAIDWSRTRAYALGSGGNLYLNLQGREPQGIIQVEAEYEETRTQIADALKTLSDPEDGSPLVQRVYRREEIYTGPQLAMAPDLVIEWSDYANWGRGGPALLNTPVLENQRHFDLSDQPLSGSHRKDGIIVAYGPSIRKGTAIQNAGLVDVMPTALSLLGLPLPDHLDGKTLGIFDAIDSPREIGELVEEKGSIPAPFEEGPTEGYTPEETQELIRRLRDLGYY